MVRHILIAASLLAMTFGGTAIAQEAPAKNDYSKPENWLCRPGRTDDACAIDLTTTVVAADGTLTKETWAANPKAAIDCFYVYPTVSADPTPNSDMNAGNEERNVVRQQFARFASQCRPYAPLYRQVTLSGLRAILAGGKVTLDEGIGYEDVKDAWNYYMKNDNNGRGVVIIGHSQGSYVLTGLIGREIEGSPAQARVISAILMGASVPAVKGKGVGGAFKTMPTCKSADQTGCVISFASFRSTIPPPANTLFGRVPGENMEAICTNPAALNGGSGALHAYLKGVPFDDNALAFDAFQEVGPGSHFLGSQHTLRNYQTAFWDSELSDNEPYEKWSEEGGSTDMATRANRKWKRVLDEYQAPVLDEAVDEQLRDFMERKKTAVSDAWH